MLLLSFLIWQCQ